MEMLIITVKIYDFDDVFDRKNAVFLLNLILYVSFFDENALFRLSAGGKGLHVQTKLALAHLQCENRQKWSEIYGYDITFNEKYSVLAGNWQKYEQFWLRYLFKVVANIFKQRELYV